VTRGQPAGDDVGDPQGFEESAVNGQMGDEGGGLLETDPRPLDENPGGRLHGAGLFDDSPFASGASHLREQHRPETAPM